MSAKFAILPAAAIRDPRVSPQHLRVLAHLTLFGGNKDSGCWPSYRVLAEQVGISRRLIIDYVRHLKECGYVEIEARQRPDGSQSSNVIRVLMDISFEIAADGEARQHHPSEPQLPLVGEPEQHPLEKNQTNEPEKVNTRNATAKARKEPRPKTNKILLQDWEAEKGCNLKWEHMADWVEEKNLDSVAVQEQIEIFRTKMMAGANRYHDFRAAFQNYVNSGYMPKTLEQLKRKNAPGRSYSETVTKGVSI